MALAASFMAGQLSHWQLARKPRDLMKYEQVYLRNIGLFTEEQQNCLRRAKVTVAGMGGVGGIQAATLARMGIGELVIMDPGVFDEPDMNRQFAAMQSTIGKNKALATAPLLKDINPFLKLTVLDRAPEKKAELADAVRGSDLVIDAIDYRGFDYKVLFAEVAREQGLYNLTAPIPDFGTLLMIFDPRGMTLEQFYEAPTDRAAWPRHDIPLVKLMGSSRRSRNLTEFLEKKRPYISSNGGAAALAGGVLAAEAAFMITGLRPPAEIVAAPRVTYVDLWTRRFEIYDASKPS